MEGGRMTHLAMESHKPLLSLFSLSRSSFILSAFFCTYIQKGHDTQCGFYLFFISCFTFRRKSGGEKTRTQTHSDFDDFAVEAVDGDDDVASVRRRVGSIVPGSGSVEEHCHS